MVSLDATELQFQTKQDRSDVLSKHIKNEITLTAEQIIQLLQFEKKYVALGEGLLKSRASKLELLLTKDDILELAQEALNLFRLPNAFRVNQYKEIFSEKLRCRSIAYRFFAALQSKYHYGEELLSLKLFYIARQVSPFSGSYGRIHFGFKTTGKAIVEKTDSKKKHFTPVEISILKVLNAKLNTREFAEKYPEAFIISEKDGHTIYKNRVIPPACCLTNEVPNSMLLPQYDISLLDFIINNQCSCNTPAYRRIALSVALDIIMAIAMLHECNIVHTDIKVDNCCMNIETGVLIDYGQSAILENPEKVPNLYYEEYSRPMFFIGSYTTATFIQKFDKELPNMDRKTLNQYLKKNDLVAFAILLFNLYSARQPSNAKAWVYLGKLEGEAYVIPSDFKYALKDIPEDIQTIILKLLDTNDTTSAYEVYQELAAPS